MTPRHFWIALGAFVAAGFALRLWYGIEIGGGNTVGDDTWYHLVANSIASGHGFVDPFASVVDGKRVMGTAGEPIKTAIHLPAFPYLLAVFSKLGLTSYTQQQAIGCALGAGTVGFAGLTARHVWDARAGLVAAGIAAVYPPLIANDSVMMSESLVGILVALDLLLVLRLRERPTTWRAIALGASLAATALTRQEALLMCLLLLPWIWKRARPQAALVVLATVVVLCAPWAIRNSLLFDRPVGLTTVDGSVIAGANLPSTYHGTALGGWDYFGTFRTPAGRSIVLNEAEQSARWRKEGIDFARDHAGRLPVVIGARILRTWGFYPFDPRTRASYVAFLQERIRWVELAAWPALILALALALAGALAIRRRRGPLWPFATPCILITVVSVTAYGDPRFAQSGNVVLVTLAGVGAVALWARRAELVARVRARSGDGAGGRRAAPAP